MLSQVTALLYIYFREQNSVSDRFTNYCLLIAILNSIGYIMNLIEQHPKAQINKNVRVIAEIVCSLSTLILSITYFIVYFLEWSLASMEIFFGLLIVWAIECAFYYVLSDIGLQSILSLFLTTNILLICGDVALKGSGNFSTIFEYSSINLIVLCAQFSWAGEPTTKKTNSLFYIISRQDCFRLMVYFLLFNVLNNTIKSFISDGNAILPTLFSIIPYIWGTSKFSQRQYKQAFGLFLISLFIYFTIEVKFKQQTIPQI